MRRWATRAGTLLVGIAAALVARRQGPVLQPSLVTAAVALGLWSASRLVRLLRLPARVIAAATLLLTILGGLYAISAGLTGSDIVTALPFVCLLAGAILVGLGTGSEAPEQRRSSSQFVVLNVRTIRPDMTRGSFRLTTIFSDVCVDLVGADLGSGRCFLEVRAFASKCEVKVSSQVAEALFELPAHVLADEEVGRYRRAPIVLQRRVHLGSTVEVVVPTAPRHPTEALGGLPL
jgi:hypothetical protein